ncbi:DNA-binding protein [Azospirillum tabaci]|uniref:DNA-binding protein n=1 Tax=Azospirillum tabaci TaxID=2752310 RepID=UPI001660FE68|nr:DNA-binding protein [Azospirillum tabaci]
MNARAYEAGDLGRSNEAGEQRDDRFDLSGDLLEGAEKIGAFMGLTARQVYHQRESLPIFTIGAKLFARKSTIMKWIAEQEMRAQAKRA